MMSSKKDWIIYRSQDRGQTNLDWLESFHSFSFGNFMDPNRMGFRSLRVLNDDRIAPGAGFAKHPHRDMEILTWVLTGALRHEDSLGNRGVIQAGEFQLMTAGKGIRHSEMNAFEDQETHFIQVWIEPKTLGLEPAYAQQSYVIEDSRNDWLNVASASGEGRSLKVNQDIRIYISHLDKGKTLRYASEKNRSIYLHVAKGGVEIDSQTLRSGDALQITQESSIQIEALQESDLLLFDLG